MDFAFSEEQEMLRASAREFLARECRSSYVRRMMGEEDAWDAEMWKRLAGLGWTALGIPEQYGGVATFMVVAARTRASGEEGVTLFLVEGRPPGMTVTPLETMDMTRRWYQVDFDGVVLPADAVMGAPDQGWSRLRRALEWGEAAICAEM